MKAAPKKARKHTESESESDYDSENDGDGEDNADEGDNKGNEESAARTTHPASRTIRPTPSGRSGEVARAVSPPTPGPSKLPQQTRAPVRFRPVPVHIHDTPRREVAAPNARGEDPVLLPSDESDEYQDASAGSPSPMNPRKKKAGNPTAIKRRAAALVDSDPDLPDVGDIIAATKSREGKTSRTSAASTKKPRDESARQDRDTQVSSSIPFTPSLILNLVSRLKVLGVNLRQNGAD